jgi:hypothetical protein
MKKLLVVILTVTGLIAFSCDDIDVTANFSNLTSNIWAADSLLANGVNAGGPGELLEDFNGILLDEGIVLPVFAPRILEMNELTEDHFLMGLFLILQKQLLFSCRCSLIYKHNHH